MISITYKMTKQTPTMNPIKAPFPHILERLGYCVCQTRYRIKPISGKKKPSTPHPALG